MKTTQFFVDSVICAVAVRSVGLMAVGSDCSYLLESLPEWQTVKEAVDSETLP